MTDTAKAKAETKDAPVSASPQNKRSPFGTTRMGDLSIPDERWSDTMNRRKS